MISSFHFSLTHGGTRRELLELEIGLRSCSESERRPLVTPDALTPSAGGLPGARSYGCSTECLLGSVTAQRRRRLCRATRTASAPSRTTCSICCCRSCRRATPCGRACSPPAGARSGGPCPRCAWILLTGCAPMTRNRFVNNLLHYRDRMAPLDVCEITCCYNNEDDDDEGCLYTEQWVHYAVSRKARVIRLQASHKMLMPLSKDALIWEHMTRLKLSYVEFEDRSVDLSSCHALEVLKIQDCVLNLAGVFSKSLRRLRIKRSHHLTRAYSTSISAPGLVNLELANCLYWMLVLESLPSLVTAFIFTGDKDECCVCYSSSDESSDESYDKADDRDDCVTLRGLTGATDLKLVTRSPLDFLEGLEDCSMFSKLKTLLLNGWCVAANFTGLVYFLQHSPNLERLRLEPDGAEEFASGSEICESYNPREHFWVSKHLKIVEILYCGVDEIIDQIWNILCTHGVSPEVIDIEYH